MASQYDALRLASLQNAIFNIVKDEVSELTELTSGRESLRFEQLNAWMIISFDYEKVIDQLVLKIQTNEGRDQISDRGEDAKVFAQKFVAYLKNHRLTKKFFAVSALPGADLAEDVLEHINGIMKRAFPWLKVGTSEGKVLKVKILHGLVRCSLATLNLTKQGEWTLDEAKEFLQKQEALIKALEQKDLSVSTSAGLVKAQVSVGPKNDGVLMYWSKNGLEESPAAINLRNIDHLWPLEWLPVTLQKRLSMQDVSIRASLLGFPELLGSGMSKFRILEELQSKTIAPRIRILALDLTVDIFTP